MEKEPKYITEKEMEDVNGGEAVWFKDAEKENESKLGIQGHVIGEGGLDY